jgi:hypothetical protein
MPVPIPTRPEYWWSKEAGTEGFEPPSKRIYGVSPSCGGPLEQMEPGDFIFENADFR